MPSYDQALKDFVAQFGEDAVESALDTYATHRDRSKKAAAKARAQKQALGNLIVASRSNPQLAETLRKAGVQLG